MRRVDTQVRLPADVIILITGVMAAGKSSVAQDVAQLLTKSVHLRGDMFRRMIVNGRSQMSAEPAQSALDQLTLRYEAAAAAAHLYLSSGFDVVYQDIIIGPMLDDVVALYRGSPLHVVVLCPRPEVVAQREQAREKSGYHGFTIEQLDAVLRNDTPRIGLWLDNSDLSVRETAEQVLASLDASAV